jgi:hypothetical protein
LQDCSPTEPPTPTEIFNPNNIPARRRPEILTARSPKPKTVISTHLCLSSFAPLFVILREAEDLLLPLLWLLPLPCFRGPPTEIVISTEATHSLTVSRAVEKPALSEVEWDPRISPFCFAWLLLGQQAAQRERIESSLT